MLKGVIQMCHLLDLLDYSYIELTNLTNNVFTIELQLKQTHMAIQVLMMRDSMLPSHP